MAGALFIPCLEGALRHTRCIASPSGGPDAFESRPAMAAKGPAASGQSGADLSEQRFGDSELCELECGGAAMSHDLGAGLDELLTKRRQRPVLDLLRQRQRAQEVAAIVGERMELELPRDCPLSNCFPTFRPSAPDLRW